MSYINTKEPLKIGGYYQYQGDRITDFGEKELTNVELIEDNSDEKDWKFKFKDLDTGEVFEDQMMKGNFYYPGMQRIWDENEYV